MIIDNRIVFYEKNECKNTKIRVVFVRYNYFKTRFNLKYTLVEQSLSRF